MSQSLRIPSRDGGDIIVTFAAPAQGSRGGEDGAGDLAIWDPMSARKCADPPERPVSASLIPASP